MGGSRLGAHQTADTREIFRAVLLVSGLVFVVAWALSTVFSALLTELAGDG